MRRYFLCLVLAIATLFSGCGAAAEELPADWEADWTVVSPLLAVEPFENYTLHESNDALYVSGIYYATWVTGEARPHTNEDGESAEIFDAQIYVLVQEFRSADSAGSNAAQWIAREKQSYDTDEEFYVTCGDQEFTILPLRSSGGSNPYSYGAAAFAVRGSWAICVEFLFADGYETDVQNTMEAFLNGFHYSE